MRWAGLLLIGLLLGGCSLGQKAALQAGIQAAQDAKDAEALLLKQGVCAMGIGAKNRVLTPEERRHAEGLCGGDGEEPITMGDLQRFLEAQ